MKDLDSESLSSSQINPRKIGIWLKKERELVNKLYPELSQQERERKAFENVLRRIKKRKEQFETPSEVVITPKMIADWYDEIMTDQIKVYPSMSLEKRSSITVEKVIKRMESIKKSVPLDKFLSAKE